MSISSNVRATRRNRLLVAVVDEQVGGAAGGTGDDTRQGKVGNSAAEAGGGGAVAEEVGSETTDVEGGHGGTVVGVGAAAGGGGDDINTRGNDIDEGAVVGEDGEGVGGVGDSAGAGSGSRGEGGGVGGRVTRSDGKEDAGIDNGLSGVVDGLGETTTKGHVHDSTVGAVLAGSVSDDKLHTSNDASVGARAIIAKDLDSQESGGLGNTVGSAADGAGNMGTVALNIVVVRVGEVGGEAGTAIEVLGLLVDGSLISTR